MRRDVFLQHWGRVAQTSPLQPTSSPPPMFPVAPGVDFPVFRAMCRRLLDPASFAVVDRTFAAALTDTLTWLDRRRSIREHFRALELELDELEAKTPYTYRDPERHVQARHALDEAWCRFDCEARNQLQALTSAGGSPSETLVRLRAAQAGYFRSGLLLQVRIPPQALRGTAEFGPAFDANLADCLRGLRTPAWPLLRCWRQARILATRLGASARWRDHRLGHGARSAQRRTACCPTTGLGAGARPAHPTPRPGCWRRRRPLLRRLDGRARTRKHRRRCQPTAILS